MKNVCINTAGLRIAMRILKIKKNESASKKTQLFRIQYFFNINKNIFIIANIHSLLGGFASSKFP